MARIVGIDFGLKRIGVAHTDPLGIAVHGKGTYDARVFWTSFENYLRTEDVRKVVIGQPSKPSDDFSKGVNELVSKIAEVNPQIEVVFQDEDFTSKDAVKTMVEMGVKEEESKDGYRPGKCGPHPAGLPWPPRIGTMILPIYIYGQPVLKKVADPIDPSYEGLSELIANMWETMYNAKGVGLAAPQIGRSIRLFIIDTVQVEG